MLSHGKWTLKFRRVMSTTKDKYVTGWVDVLCTPITGSAHHCPLNELEFEPSSEPHDISGVHTLFDRLQLLDVIPVHLLQWGSGNRIIGIASSNLNPETARRTTNFFCSFFHKILHGRIGFDASPRGVDWEGRESNGSTGWISARNIWMGKDVGKEWFNRVSVQETVFHAGHMVRSPILCMGEERNCDYE